MKKSVTLLTALAVACFFSKTFAQGLPDEMYLSADGKHLVTGGLPTTGFYDRNTFHTIELWFDEPNYWSLLTANYQSGTDLGALMIVDGDTLASEVGVRFKGQTSFQQIQNSQKKSFNITIDFADPDQDLAGYNTLNLNNCFQDPSFLREVVYLELSRQHTTSLKANFVQLFINGTYWGPYPSVQALDNVFLKEWLLSSDGTRWRALKTIGGGGPGGGGGTGGPFGTGYCSLNWLGTSDSTEYKKYYTLKKTSKTNPWEDLVRVCDKLNNTPVANLEDTIQQYLDLDRTLWYLATEILFADDDGYVWKGGMDYYLYWEPESGHLMPLEYDGNSSMELQNTGWSPFYNETDTRFPLLNRLLANPGIRQRYLAHLRTLIEDDLDQSKVDAIIDYYYELIDPYVASDTKKIYSYADFQSGKTELKDFVSGRRSFLQGNAQVNVQGLDITAVDYTAAGGAWAAPAAGEAVNVTAQVGGTLPINRVNLFYGTGLVGGFTEVQLFDDGAHNDGAAGDGLFGASIPGFGNGTHVRFYVEAIADNTPKTATYLPKGAEHDVFHYQVGVTEFFASEVVVNELMASNSTAVADQDGEYDDWIELYNNGSGEVNLSGWYLTDNLNNLQKWSFPEGTVIAAGGYLIVWADENGSEAGLHANFKLSASGETLYLLDPSLRIGQEITFGQQITDKGYARSPNGTGGFVIKNPTFSYNNDNLSAANEAIAHHLLLISPNPAGQSVQVRAVGEHLPSEIAVFNSLGRKMSVLAWDGQANLDVSNWPSGVYVVKCGTVSQRLVVE